MRMLLGDRLVYKECDFKCLRYFIYFVHVGYLVKYSVIDVFISIFHFQYFSIKIKRLSEPIT